MKNEKEKTITKRKMLVYLLSFIVRWKLLIKQNAFMKIKEIEKEREGDRETDIETEKRETERQK
jgi:hypothetical protein